MSVRSIVTSNLQRLEKQFAAYNEITVSRSALLHNFDFFQSLSPGGLVIPVLKANAYGHGLAQVSAILKKRRFPYIAVDGYFEALRIHDISSQPVLIMGAINPENYRRMSFRNSAFVVQDHRTIQALGAARRKVKVHLELDTGMGRHGIRWTELDEYIHQLKQHRNLDVEGVMTHLADADDPAGDEFTMVQARRFDQAVEHLRKAGYTLKFRHIANSAGSVKDPSSAANAVRIGIALYGIPPLEPGGAVHKRLKNLKPVLEMTSTIAKVQRVEPGDTVSYNRTYTVRKRGQIGVLPLGYYEGIPRKLSNAGQVMLGDTPLPIVGRVCMNHTMVDLSGTSAAYGDKVTIISRETGSPVSLNAIARKHNLFNYELLVRLNETVRRRITD